MQVGELLQRAGGFLTRTSCSSPGGSTSSCRSYGAERPPGLLSKKGETHFHPGPSWTRAPTSTVPRTPVRPQFGAMTSWKFHRAARACTSNGPWGPTRSRVRTVPSVTAPNPAAPCAREDTTGPDLAHCFAKITGRKDLPCRSLQGAQPRSSRSKPEVEDPGAKTHRLSRWEHQRVPGVLR